MSQRSDLRPVPERSFSRAEWLALFMLELALCKDRPLSSRAARALAERSLAEHSDLSPSEALQLWRSS